MYNHSTIHDKLEEIKESIELIQEWSKDVESADELPELKNIIEDLLSQY